MDKARKAPNFAEHYSAEAKDCCEKNEWGFKEIERIKLREALNSMCCLELQNETYSRSDFEDTLVIQGSQPTLMFCCNKCGNKVNSAWNNLLDL